jgi:hypothetical protein
VNTEFNTITWTFPQPNKADKIARFADKCLLPSKIMFCTFIVTRELCIVQKQRGTLQEHEINRETEGAPFVWLWDWTRTRDTEKKKKKMRSYANGSRL